MNQKEPEWKPPSWYLKIAIWSSVFFGLLFSFIGEIDECLAYRSYNLDVARIDWALVASRRNEVPRARVEARRAGQVRPEKKADIETESPSGSTDLEALIEKYSEQYQVRATLVRCIVLKESGGRAEAVGDKGKAVGLCQFHLPTFQSFRKQMGESTADTRTNPDDSIRVLAWALSKGYAHHWSVYKSGKCH